MEIKNFVEELSQLKKDSETLQEIKKIMHNDGTIGIIEQITHLQNNTQANNINHLQVALDKIADKLDSVDSEFRDQYDSVSNAIGYLEEVTEYSNYIEDACQAIDDLKLELDTIAEDSKPTAKKTTAKKTTEQK